MHGRVCEELRIYLHNPLDLAPCLIDAPWLCVVPWASGCSHLCWDSGALSVRLWLGRGMGLRPDTHSEMLWTRSRGE